MGLVARLVTRIKRKYKINKKDSLFKGDDELFKKILANARVYGEYGCGQSTNWVLSNTCAQVMSVDTSGEWVEQVLSNAPSKNEKLSVVHIDLGAVVQWGYPVDYQHGERFHEYTDWIWQQDQKPDTVLIDGRFRVCCFLTSLKYAEEGAFLIFDDYVDRPYYHVVEKYVSRASECGRQCLFVVPATDKIDYQALEQDIANFRYVMD